MNQKGFSIIELVVSTAIIGIISAIVFANYRTMDNQLFVEEQSFVVMSAISEARNMALAARKVEDASSGEQVDYYTIRFEEEEYILLEDTDQEARFTYEEPIYLSEGQGTKIGFAPPDPKVNFYGNGDNGSVILELNHPGDEAQPVEIEVNKAGLIQIVE